MLKRRLIVSLHMILETKALISSAVSDYECERHSHLTQSSIQVKSSAVLIYQVIYRGQRSFFSFIVVISFWLKTIIVYIFTS